jgi:hypothetical protein
MDPGFRWGDARVGSIELCSVRYVSNISPVTGNPSILSPANRIASTIRIAEAIVSNPTAFPMRLSRFG